MKDHYQLGDAEYNALIASGVSVSDMYKLRESFAVEFGNEDNHTVPVGKIGLLLYIDRTGGDWVEGEANNKSDLIAQAVFEGLSIQDKIEIAEYTTWEDEE